MSATAPLRRPFGMRTSAVPATKPAAEPIARSRPRLVLVAPARPSAGRLPFVILLSAVLVGGLLLLLMLHTLAAQDGFTVNKLQQQLNTLTDTEQGLEQQVQADSAPSALRARASALGMVPSMVASYHKLHGGRAIGLQQPVYVAPPVTTSTAATKPTKAGSDTTTATTAAAGTTATSTGATATSTGTTTTSTATTTKSTATKPASTTTAQHPARPHHHTAAHQ